MQHLNPDRLHTRWEPKIYKDRLLLPRRYTLTHSDRTGDLFLTIGSDYNRTQISGWYTRLMRDEVLASWEQDDNGFTLHVYCHVSGGLVFGGAHFREAIFRRHMPLVLEAFRFGDRELCDTHPYLDQAPIIVHFDSKNIRLNRTESWGLFSDYR